MRMKGCHLHCAGHHAGILGHFFSLYVYLLALQLALRFSFSLKWRLRVHRLKSLNQRRTPRGATDYALALSHESQEKNLWAEMVTHRGRESALPKHWTLRRRIKPRIYQNPNQGTRLFLIVEQSLAHNRRTPCVFE